MYNLYMALILCVLNILLLIILLVRQHSSSSANAERGKLNDSCDITSLCNAGLVCSSGICKVPEDGICDKDLDCATDNYCDQGICTRIIPDCPTNNNSCSYSNSNSCSCYNCNSYKT